MDRRHIYEELNFYKCQLNAINYISRLQIKVNRVLFGYMVIEQIGRFAVNSLSAATDWIFYKTTILNARTGYLSGINMELDQLIIYWFPDNVQFLIDVPFASQSAKIARIRCKSSQFRLITANHFAYTPNTIKYIYIFYIHHLDLRECGVEIIDENAFNQLCYSLEILDLSDNRLKTISMLMIDTVFSSGKLRSILLQNNSFDCNCEFGRLQSVLNFNLNNRFGCDSNRSFIPDNCTDLQVIQSKSICLENYALNSSTYLKFLLKIIPATGSLMAKSPSAAGKFRLWFRSLLNIDAYNSKWGHLVHRKCPRQAFLKQTVNCSIFKDQDMVEIPLPINQITLICVFYLSQSPKRVWPLHCIIHRGVMPLNVGLNMWHTFYGGALFWPHWRYSFDGASNGKTPFKLKQCTIKSIILRHQKLIRKVYEDKSHQHKLMIMNMQQSANTSIVINEQCRGNWGKVVHK